MSPGKRTLHIIIGCDTDPDRQDFVDGASVERLSWRGMSEGIPILKGMVDDLIDSDGRAPVFTWLLRVDEQIRMLHGEYGWILQNFRRLLLDLESTGDELGWHPHFYRLDEKKKNWFQEINDVEWQTGMLHQAYDAYMKIFPDRARSVRMGWDYHNNATMRKLDELGVKIDFSAVPGLSTKATSSRKIHNVYDWYISPREPFFPSKTDYRRGVVEGEESLSILELPNFTSKSFIWGIISGLQFMRKMNDITQLLKAIKHATYWINLTGRPGLFSPIASQLRRDLRNAKQPDLFFATYFHADELLDNKSSLYDRSSLRTNLETIIKICEDENYAVKFLRAGQIPSIIQN